MRLLLILTLLVAVARAYQKDDRWQSGEWVDAAEDEVGAYVMYHANETEWIPAKMRKICPVGMVFAPCMPCPRCNCGPYSCDDCYGTMQCMPCVPGCVCPQVGDGMGVMLPSGTCGSCEQCPGGFPAGVSIDEYLAGLIVPCHSSDHSVCAADDL